MHDHGQSECRQLFDAVSPYLDRELDGAACDEFTRHMADCEPCQRYLDSIRATRDALRCVGEIPELPTAEAEALLQDCLRIFRAQAGCKGTP